MRNELKPSCARHPIVSLKIRPELYLSVDKDRVPRRGVADGWRRRFPGRAGIVSG